MTRTAMVFFFWALLLHGFLSVDLVRSQTQTMCLAQVFLANRVCSLLPLDMTPKQHEEMGTYVNGRKQTKGHDELDGDEHGKGNKHRREGRRKKGGREEEHDPREHTHQSKHRQDQGHGKKKKKTNRHPHEHTGENKGNHFHGGHGDEGEDYKKRNKNNHEEDGRKSGHGGEREHDEHTHQNKNKHDEERRRKGGHHVPAPERSRHRHGGNRRWVEEHYEEMSDHAHLKEECCKRLKEIDPVCVCTALTRLPIRFLTRPVHNYTLALEDSCDVSFECDSV